jgi:hypothetical protein
MKDEGPGWRRLAVEEEEDGSFDMLGACETAGGWVVCVSPAKRSGNGETEEGWL